MTGRLSGNGPSHPAERNALYEAGWRPNSVKLGDQWVSYQLFQPVSVQAAIVANASEAWAEGQADDETAATIASQTLGRSLSSFLSQSFLSGLFDFVEAINNPERSWARVAGRTASRLVPLSSSVRTVQQGLDPVVQQPRGIQETVEAGLPGRSLSLRPRLTRFGEPVVREGGPAAGMVDPFNVSSVQHVPVADELSRLGINLSVPRGRLTLPAVVRRRTGLTDAPLTLEQSLALRQVQGHAVRAALEQVMRSRTYRTMSDLARESVVRSTVTRVSTRVRNQARHELMQMSAPRR